MGGRSSTLDSGMEGDEQGYLACVFLFFSFPFLPNSSLLFLSYFYFLLTKLFSDNCFFCLSGRIRITPSM